MKVINFFGGPGVGKSTTAAKLFVKMKEEGLKVEYVTEYAKDIVYSKEFFKLEDQLMVFAKQNHKLWRLRGQVDFAIVDSPLPLSCIYAPSNMMYNPEHLDELVMSTFNAYDNLNIYLQRNLEVHGYQEYGRTQNLQEAIDVDFNIKELLYHTNTPYNTVVVDTLTADTVYALILGT
jgi:hypothetical protein